MFQTQYFTNYFILCYDSVRDIVFITTQKCGQTFIGTHLDGVHFEVMNHKKGNRPTYQLGDKILHEFTEAGSSFKELFNCETVEEVLNTKQCYFVIRNPKKRFFSGVAQIIIQRFKETEDASDIWDFKKYNEPEVEVIKHMKSDEGQDWLRKELSKLSLSDLDDEHIYPIFDFYTKYLWRPHHKTINLSDLSSWFEGVEPKRWNPYLINDKSEIYKKWILDSEHPIHRLLLEYDDIYNKEVIAWENLKREEC